MVDADLFACGIATLIQTVGFFPFGIRMPVVMGATAVAIQPMLTMAATPGVRLDGIYGAVIAVGGIVMTAIMAPIVTLTAPRGLIVQVPG